MGADTPESTSPAVRRISTPPWGKNREMELESPNSVLTKTLGAVATKQQFGSPRDEPAGVRVLGLSLAADDYHDKPSTTAGGALRVVRCRVRLAGSSPRCGEGGTHNRHTSRPANLQELQVRQGLDSTRPLFEKSRLSVTTSAANVRSSSLPPPRKPPPAAQAAIPNLETFELSWSGPRREWSRAVPTTASHEFDPRSDASPRLKRSMRLREARSDGQLAVVRHREKMRQTGVGLGLWGVGMRPTTCSWVGQRSALLEARRLATLPTGRPEWSTRFTCGLPVQAARGCSPPGGYNRWPNATSTFLDRPPGRSLPPIGGILSAP